MKPKLVAAAAIALAGCGESDPLPDREFAAGYRRSPPSELIDSQGRPFGYTIDLADEAARRAGIRLRWVHAPDGPDAALPSGRVDLWPHMAALPERRGRIHITRPYRESVYALAVRGDSGLSGPEEFGTRRLAHWAAWWPQRSAIRLFPRAAYVPEPDQQSAVDALCRGQADGALVYIYDGSPDPKPAPAACASLTLRMFLLDSSGSPFGVGASLARPGATAAAEKLRDAIDSMALDGTLNGISLKWYGTAGPERGVFQKLVQERRWNMALLAGLAVLTLALAIFAYAAVRFRRAKIEAEGARRQAEAANRAKADFLTTLSHELRTPMAGVLGMAETLRQSALSGPQCESVEVIQRSAESLLALIDDMLDFAKLEAGRLTIHARPFELWTVIEESALALEARARDRGLELRFEFGPDLPKYAVGDALRLRQVLLNLVSNAIKFTGAGGIAVKASVAGWLGPEARVRIAVRDNGMGIAAGKQHLLFQRFSQLDSSSTRRHGGTGLGLAIAKELVAAMKGRIGVESQEGEGAEFWFELPLPATPETARPTPVAGRVVRCGSREAARQAAALLEIWGLTEIVPVEVSPGALACPVRPSVLWRTLSEEAPLSPASEPVLSGRRVLLVEDNLVNQRVSSAMLRKLGLEVDLAMHGGEALERWTARRYDAILMDCTMPVMDGYEATRRIRERESGGARTPIIALTANAIGGAREACLAAGMDDFVTKPVRMDALAPLLTRWVGSSA